MNEQVTLCPIQLIAQLQYKDCNLIQIKKTDDKLISNDFMRTNHRHLQQKHFLPCAIYQQNGDEISPRLLKKCKTLFNYLGLTEPFLLMTETIDFVTYLRNHKNVDHHNTATKIQQQNTTETNPLPSIAQFINIGITTKTLHRLEFHGITNNVFRVILYGKIPFHAPYVNQCTINPTSPPLHRFDTNIHFKTKRF